MAQNATAEYYDKQAALTKKNADLAYNTALANLARRYGVANRQLESNLEARGILRSGEANTYRTELTAEEQAEKTAAEMAKRGAYNQADLTLAQQMAALGSSGGGTSTPPAVLPPNPSKPPNPPVYDFSKVDFEALGRMMRPVRAATPTRRMIGSADTNERRIMRSTSPATFKYGSADTRERRGR